ncbi:Mur ligase family protein, partial [Salmonella enterica]|uniref:Mur ligase family protein n=1 Tax=Salmonella enterica TaxID=28901 RepID=UPI000CB5376C
LFIHPEDEPLLTNQAAPTIVERTFGKNTEADIFADNVVEQTDKTQFTVGDLSDKEEKTTAITLPIPGKHNGQNALIAILVGLEYNVPFSMIKAGLEKLTLTK